jgi:toxin ParE1/3/4
MAQINWTIQALSDIEYISRRSEKYASIHVKRLLDKTLVLEKFPLSGTIVPEINNAAIRELTLGYYRIIYKIVDKDRIDILTVHHYRQLLSNNPLLGEE